MNMEINIYQSISFHLENVMHMPHLAEKMKSHKNTDF